MPKKSHGHSTRLESLIENLRMQGMKATPHRKVILELMLKKHGPYSAEQIHAKLSKDHCDLVTVYRNLMHLEKRGVIKRCDFGDGVARYELDLDQDHHHHHLICKECKKVETLDLCEIEELIHQQAKKFKFKQISHRLELFGTCPKCF